MRRTRERSAGDGADIITEEAEVRVEAMSIGVVLTVDGNTVTTE
jgi:hypothetical protein